MSPYGSASLESGITSEVPRLNNCSEQELKIFRDYILVQDAARDNLGATKTFSIGPS